MFVLLFGVVMVLSGKVGKCVVIVFEDLNIVILKFVILLMNIVFYGVFFLMVKLFIIIDFKFIISFVLYFGVVVFVFLIYGFVNYSILLKVLIGLNLVMFLKKMKNVCLFVFSILSLSVIMFIIFEIVSKKFGVYNLVVLFMVFLGVIINMDGIVIM